jgi:hypothetical protein
MKKSLADSNERAMIVSRLQKLAPDSPRQWGRMTPHQAVCHLSDSFRSMMNPVPITSLSNVFSRTFVRWIAIHSGTALAARREDDAGGGSGGRRHQARGIHPRQV